MTARLLVQLSPGALPGNDSGQVVRTHVPLFTKQYNLVPVKGRWCPEAGKVTVGLASHWPCVTNSSGLSTYELNSREWEMSTPLTPQRGMARFTFTFNNLMKKNYLLPPSEPEVRTTYPPMPRPKSPWRSLHTKHQKTLEDMVHNCRKKVKVCSIKSKELPV